MNTGINEHNLRELAYRIWEAEGCPPGQAERHWQMAMEQAGLDQDTRITGESFLGETNSENLLQDERQYDLQNNPFADEMTQTTMEAEGMNTPQQPLDTQPIKAAGKRKSGKNKTTEAQDTLAAQDTFAGQDTLASQNIKEKSPGKGRRKSSDNILV